MPVAAATTPFLRPSPPTRQPRSGRTAALRHPTRDPVASRKRGRRVLPPLRPPARAPRTEPVPPPPPPPPPP
ncbi:MAG: hypothetical protein F4X74_04770, partial [Acidimicrobiia bacterium]|nr:hypothetical protein [Acidimicrobiia bacterium]